MALTPCSDVCTCVPYSNQCCCTARTPITNVYSGTSVTQPTCQLVPTDPYVFGAPITTTRTSFNPCANTSGISFWTYKFLTDCRTGLEGTNAISHVDIPICSTLTLDNIAVYEKVDSCGSFTRLFEPDITLITTDNACAPNVTPPPGFQFLKISNNGRFGKGVCVAYLIAINGNVDPVTGQTIVVKTDVCNFAGGGSSGCAANCFIVPGCGKINLNVTKTCSTFNHTVQFNVQITGGTAPVTITDNLFIPAGVSAILGPLPAGCTAFFNGNPVNPGDLLTGPGTLTLICNETTPVNLAFTLQIVTAPIGSTAQLVNAVTDVVSTNPSFPISVTGLPASACLNTTAAVINVCAPCP